MRKIILLFFVLLLTAIGYTQESSCAKKFQEQSIYEEGRGYMMNNKALTRLEVKDLLTKNTNSSTEYMAYKKKSLLSAILLSSSTVLFSIAIIQRKKNKDASVGFAIAGLTSQLISIPISIKARKNLHKAVWQYNKSIW